MIAFAVLAVLISSALAILSGSPLSEPTLVSNDVIKEAPVPGLGSVNPDGVNNLPLSADEVKAVMENRQSLLNADKLKAANINNLMSGVKNVFKIVQKVFVGSEDGLASADVKQFIETLGGTKLSAALNILNG